MIPLQMTFMDLTASSEHHKRFLWGSPLTEVIWMRNLSRGSCILTLHPSSVINGSCGIFRGWSLDGGSSSLGLARLPHFLSLSPSLLPLCTRNEISAFWVPCLPCTWIMLLLKLYAKTKLNKKPKINPFPLTCSFVMECFHSYCYTHFHYILVQSCWHWIMMSQALKTDLYHLTAVFHCAS